MRRVSAAGEPLLAAIVARCRWPVLHTVAFVIVVIANLLLSL